MIKIRSSIQLFKHREFSDWHAPLKPQGLTLTCPDANCPWKEHWPDNSEHDPESVDEILALPPGTRMLILSDYCERWYVSFLTLESIFEPKGATQLRFTEGSRQCWYFLPGGAGGHMLYLDSVRYIAVVESSAPAFGKDGKLPCFARELSRIGKIPLPEIQKGLRELEKSMANPPILLRPWHMQATSLWNHFYYQNYRPLIDELQFLLGFKNGHYPAAIFFVVAAQRQRLQELSNIPGIENVFFPSDFGISITEAIGNIFTSPMILKQERKSWRNDLRKCFGI